MAAETITAETVEIMAVEMVHLVVTKALVHLKECHHHTMIHEEVLLHLLDT